MQPQRPFAPNTYTLDVAMRVEMGDVTDWDTIPKRTVELLAAYVRQLLVYYEAVLNAERAAEVDRLSSLPQPHGVMLTPANEAVISWNIDARFYNNLHVFLAKKPRSTAEQ